MTYDEIKEGLSRIDDPTTDQFELIRQISHKVNSSSSHNEGRDLVIRLLATREKIDVAYNEIISTLLRNTGLFPYMTEHIKYSDEGDRLAYELHRASNLDNDIIFHSLQFRIYHQLVAGSNVVLSAATSVGKSLIIDAVIASGKHRNIVIIVPTIALIDEARRRISKKFGHQCSIITHATQRANTHGRNIYILTQERVLQREDLDNTSLLIVDEFYKLNVRGEEQPERAIDLNLAFHKIAKTGTQFYLLGPNVQEVIGLDKYEYHFIPSEFSTVAVDITLLDLPYRGNERIIKTKELCKDLGGPDRAPVGGQDSMRVLRDGFLCLV
jgi:hypothetical protein